MDTSKFTKCFWPTDLIELAIAMSMSVACLSRIWTLAKRLVRITFVQGGRGRNFGSLFVVYHRKLPETSENFPKTVVVEILGAYALPAPGS